MTIEIKRVSSKADLKTFMFLPVELYRTFAEYVPPLAMETRGFLDPKSAPFYKHGEAVYWIAYKNDAPVGRISAQSDDKQPASAFGNAGLFGCLDVIDDIEVTAALMSVAEDWLREKGFETAIGPFMLNINGLAGMLVEGYELEPMMMATWHPPYLKEHLEKLPYEPVRDLHFWRMDWTSEREAEHASQRELPELPKDISIRHLNFKDLAGDVEIIRQIYNDAWQENWGFVPLLPEDVEAISKDLKPVIRPEFGLIVEKKGKPVAVMLVIPNLYELTGDLGAKPSPIGWLKLVWRMFRPQFNSGCIFLFGVGKEMRYSVGGAVIAMWMVRHIISSLLNLKRQQGFIEAGWVLDNNKSLQSILVQHGFHKARTLRLFERQLNS